MEEKLEMTGRDGIRAQVCFGQEEGDFGCVLLKTCSQILLKYYRIHDIGSILSLGDPIKCESANICPQVLWTYGKYAAKMGCGY